MNPLSRIRWRRQAQTKPFLPFSLRLAGIIFFLGITVWTTSPVLLGVAVIGAVVFRFFCGCSRTGLPGEVLFSLSAALLWGILTAGFSPLDEIIPGFLKIFARMFLVFSPSLAFSRSLNTRELGWNMSWALPPALILGLETSLRFIPVLLMELSDVIAIQSARQAFCAVHPVRSLRALIYPFFLRLFRISERVAYGLQTRRINPNQVPRRISPEMVQAFILNGFQEESACPDLSRELSARSPTNT
jgi:energy-coupling factor transporter transmembrane protein EcfT